MSGASDLIDTEHGLKYWESIDADENGMLGGIPEVPGFQNISRIDLQGSRNFLAKLGIGSRKGLHKVENAMDGGAGIGRITRGLLLDIANQVDVVEPIAKFTASLQGVPGIRDIENVGLEHWHPKPDNRYDLIWTQWCVGHLTNDQLVEYLIRCKDALHPGGLIVVKENINTGITDAFDETDSAVTRHETTFKDVFEKAGLHIKKTELQRGVPSTPDFKLLPVRMWALQPKPAASALSGGPRTRASDH